MKYILVSVFMLSVVLTFPTSGSVYCSVTGSQDEPKIW